MASLKTISLSKKTNSCLQYNNKIKVPLLKIFDYYLHSSLKGLCVSLGCQFD
jgi:hypothetical protein